MDPQSTRENLIPPVIHPVVGDGPRPMWSVAIPTFNCAKYLRQTLESVLAQDPGADQMQIEVVDDCSTKDDPEAVVRELGQGRVAFYRKPKNEGAILNFNTCIQRSRGKLLHILHGDDWVAQGFYRTVERQFLAHEMVGLVATRSFFVEEDGVILATTPRLKELEMPSREVGSFFCQNPLQTPSVVVRRSAYETLGGFLPALVHTADCEMWVRVISNVGGIVAPDVLASYRSFSANDSSRLARTGENVADVIRLYDLFAGLFPTFSREKAQQRVSEFAMRQHMRFAEAGDSDAAAANLALWKRIATKRQKLMHFVRSSVRTARRAQVAWQSTLKPKGPSVPVGSLP